MDCKYCKGEDILREPRKQLKAKTTDNEKTAAEEFADALLRLPSSRIKIMLASSLGVALKED